jgi:hypothetical protein
VRRRETQWETQWKRRLGRNSGGRRGCHTAVSPPDVQVVNGRRHPTRLLEGDSMEARCPWSGWQVRP